MIINFRYTVTFFTTDSDLKIYGVKTDGKRTQKEMKDFITNFIVDGRIKIIKSFNSIHEMHVYDSVNAIDMLSDIEFENDIESVCHKIYSAEYETVTETVTETE